MTDLEDSLSRLDIRRRVRLFQSREVNVPMTWGLRHAVILLPTTADVWTADERRMVLRHELAHVRGADWAFGLAARFACALFWFHPGVWLIAGALRRDAERAADDRVISSGVARSDYAELLIAASTGGVGTSRVETALALSGRGPLRTRLAAILDVGHEVRPLARRWTLVATAACAVSAVPLCGVEIVPTRDVLASLMRDSRWESRAYAVIGLAHRAKRGGAGSQSARAGVGALRARPASRSGAQFRRGRSPVTTFRWE
jgi:beta-lactamase regulating signal transducer with metallopeptidase domain